MARADERKFIVFPRGQVRDEIILSAFRIALRQLINSDTGTFFTEDEIARVTAEGGRFYIEADAIDLYGQAAQARALFFADQVDPRRAATPYLENVHGNLWGVFRLAATGGSGPVSAVATPGEIFVGSTTIGDPAAHTCRADISGKRFQVLTTTTTPASGIATLDLKAIDTGKNTNPKEGETFTWMQSPLSAAPQCTATDDFSGGFDEETDQQMANRIVDRIRNRPASGNNSHFRSWAREASSAVETAFVYACAFHAGSVLVAPIQKRSTTGPEARIPSVGTALDVTVYLTPPGSPVVPHHVYVVVAGPTPEPSNLILKLSMRKGSVGGWFNTTPWPGHVSAQSVVQGGPSQTAFSINSDTLLPGGAASLSGVNAPSIMIWDVASSRWERINVTSITDAGAGVFNVVCTAPVHTITAGDVISPYTDRLITIAEGLESYFDSLGPGEVVGSTDLRFTRAARYPRPSSEAVARVGSPVITRLQELLGGSLADAELTSATPSTPSVAVDPTNGPQLLTLGKVGIYSLD